MSEDRNCNFCVYSARNGDCRKWDCEGTKTVEDIKAETIAEVKEVLASMVIHEVISTFAYEHICVLIGAGDDGKK